jgi:hypothetical protein
MFTNQYDSQKKVYVLFVVPIICQGISGRRPSTKKQLAIFGI